MKWFRGDKFHKWMVIVLLLLPVLYSVKVHLQKLGQLSGAQEMNYNFSPNNIISKSLEALKKNVAENPSYLAYLELAKKHEESGNIEEAVENFKKAVNLNDSSAYAHYYLCKLLNQQGFYERAIGHCDKCLALVPGFELAEYQREISSNRIMGISDWK